MKGKFFLFLVILLNTSYISNSRAESIHEKCLKAQDYQGCVNALSKIDDKNNISNIFNIFNIFKPNRLSSCIRDLKLIRENESNFNIYTQRLGELDDESYNLACESILAVDKKYNVFSDFKKTCFLTNYHSFLVSNDNLVKKKFYSPRNISNYCDCYGKNYSKNLSWFNSDNEKIGSSCAIKEIYTFKNAGYRYYDPEFLLGVFHNRDNTWDYALDDSSVKQKMIRNKYGRYLTFFGKTNNPFTGDYIPAKPGYIDCDWDGSGNAYFDQDYGSGSWSSGGSCYGEEGTDEIVIPGGVDKRFYKYTLDCVDLTFDRKGDRVNYAGGAMKGWMKIGNDPTAVMAADIYCPIIKRLSRN